MKWIDDFRQTLELDDKSINTINSYCSDVQEFLVWFYDAYAKEFAGQLLE